MSDGSVDRPVTLVNRAPSGSREVVSDLIRLFFSH